MASENSLKLMRSGSSITIYYKMVPLFECDAHKTGSGGGVNQKIEEELVTLTKIVTIWYNHVMNVLEKYSKPFNKTNLLLL
jgi:hypothetical protein